MNWSMRTQSDFNNPMGAGDLPELSLGYVPDQLWADVRVSLGYANLSQWPDVDLGHGLLDMFRFDGQWVVVFRARGRGYGSTGTYQLVLPPVSFEPADSWASVRAAQDDAGWIRPEGLPDSAPGTAVSGYDAAAVRQAYEELVDGKGVVIVPREGAADTIGRLLEVVPATFAGQTTWSTGRLPLNRVEQPTVTGELEPEFQEPMHDSWGIVERAAAQGTTADTSQSWRKAVSFLLTKERGAVPGRDSESFWRQLEEAERLRPRSPEEVYRELGVATMRDGVTLLEPELAQLGTVPLATLRTWVTKHPALGRALIEQADGEMREQAFDTMFGLSQKDNPFHLPLDEPWVIRPGLNEYLRAQSVDLLTDLVERVLAANYMNDREKRRRVEPLFRRLGLTPENSPDLFGFDIAGAAALLDQYGGEAAFAQHLAGLSLRPDDDDIVETVMAAGITSGARIGVIVSHLALHRLVRPEDQLLERLGELSTTHAADIATWIRQQAQQQRRQSDDGDAMAIKLSILRAVLVNDHNDEGWIAARDWFSSQTPSRVVPVTRAKRRKHEETPPGSALPVTARRRFDPRSMFAEAERDNDSWVVVVIAVAAVVFVVLLVALMMLKRDDQNGEGASAQRTNGPTASTNRKPSFTVVQSTEGDQEVLAQDATFEPSVVALRVGEKVRIDGGSLSDPVSLDVNQRNVGTIGPGSITLRFDRAGTYLLSMSGASSSGCVVTVD